MSKVVLKNECYKEKTVLNSVNLNDVEFSENNMNRAFKGCTNLTRVTNINEDITTLNEAFYNCSNLKEDIYIESENITSCNDVFTGNTYLKKVYIPYYNSNNEHTTTYNTFINAGYDEAGSKDCIYLDDINDPHGVTIHRYAPISTYKARYGFMTDDGTAVISLIDWQYEGTRQTARINFYNKQNELIDYFYMPNHGDIDGLNATHWEALLGCVGMDMPTTYQYSTYQKCRFFKYGNKYWAYYLSLPFYIWYSFVKSGKIYCFPNSPWQANRVTLNTYQQTGLNTFTRGTNSADTSYCYPVYYSHTNNIIYAMYMTSSGGANSKYVINLDSSYNITSKTSGFTISGDDFKVSWYSDVATPIRELNSDFTPGNLQITKLTNSAGKTQWFVISETAKGTLNCNSTRNTNLQNYFNTVFNNFSTNWIPEICALPGNSFLAFYIRSGTQVTGGGYRIYKFHFNGNEVVDDGLYLCVPAGYSAPSNGSRNFVNYFTKEVGWCFTKSDTAEYTIVTKPFTTTADLPNFLNTQTEQPCLSVKLQFRNAYTHELIEDIYDDLVIPYVNFDGAIATRNMYEFLVPHSGTYYIGFTEDQSHNNKYLAPYYEEYEITTDGQVITIDLTPNPDQPDTKFDGTIKSWYGNNDPYYNYMLLNNNSWLLANYYEYSENKSYSLPLTNEFTVNEWDVLNTQWDTDLYPESSSWLEDYSYILPCYGDGYYVASPNPKQGDHVFTFTLDGTNCTKNIIAEFTGSETSASGKAYIDSQNRLHINGVGTFNYNADKSGLIIKY